MHNFYGVDTRQSQGWRNHTSTSATAFTPAAHSATVMSTVSPQRCRLHWLSDLLDQPRQKSARLLRSTQLSLPLHHNRLRDGTHDTQELRQPGSPCPAPLQPDTSVWHCRPAVSFHAHYHKSRLTLDSLIILSLMYIRIFLLFVLFSVALLPVTSNTGHYIEPKFPPNRERLAYDRPTDTRLDGDLNIAPTQRTDEVSLRTHLQFRAKAASHLRHNSTRLWRKTNSWNLHHDNMVFSDKDKILIKTHKYTQNTVIRTEELKLVQLKCYLFAFSSILAEYLQIFEFLIFRGSVATCLRWRFCSKFHTLSSVAKVLKIG